MRKRSSYRPRTVVPPMLVSRGIINDDLETRERMIVEAFAGGWATETHHDEIADMRNILVIAAEFQGDDDVIKTCDTVSDVMANIRKRYESTGRMGVTGDELSFLRLFLDIYRDFWMRQTTGAYLKACDVLTRTHHLLKNT